MSTGPHVVLTREPEDNRALAQALHERGVPVVQIPCVATRYLEPEFLPPAVDAVTFSSRRGVEGLLRSEAGKTWLDGLPAARIGVVGPATGAALADAGRQVEWVADPARGEALAALIAASLAAGARVAVVRGNLRAGAMDELLREAGLSLSPIQVYENLTPDIPVLDPSAATAVFFASPSAARRMFGANPWMRERICLAIGATTATALTDLGVAAPLQAGAELGEWIEALCAAHFRALETTSSEKNRE